MGHKINPIGFRVGVLNNWNSRWFVDNKLYSKFLLEDINIRSFLNKHLKEAIISKIEIERKRFENKLYKIIISAFVFQSGIISKKIVSIEKELKLKYNENLEFKIFQVPEPFLDAKIISKLIALDLEKRMNFKFVQKKYLFKVKKAGAKGCCIVIGGRLNGNDIARSEKVKIGSIPLSTIKSNIDFAKAEAKTKFGNLGIKVWIYKSNYSEKNLNNNKNFNRSFNNKNNNYFDYKKNNYRHFNINNNIDKNNLNINNRNNK